MANIPGLLVVFAAIFVVPALIGRFVIGGDWRQVGAAYVLWFGLLLVTLVLPKGGTLSEKFGWMIILSMLLSIVVVPVLTLIQKLAGWALFKLG